MKRYYSNSCLATNPLLEEGLQEEMEAGSEASLLGIPYPTTLVVTEGSPGLCVTF